MSNHGQKTTGTDQDPGISRTTLRTLLICHHDAPLDHEGMASWLASFSDLTGIVQITERPDRMKMRIRREIERVGRLRFLFDVLPFRLYYRLFLAKKDARWEKGELTRLRQHYPLSHSAAVLDTHSPNSKASREFIEAAAPDIIIARCKFLLKKSVFSVARAGTFVMHPGICPEYRNAHGGFWALANDETDKVGVTLLKIDEGIDTGPVYGYFSYDYDEMEQSHIQIQARCVTENLGALADKLQAIALGKAETIDTQGRESAEWGQPWLSRYAYWRRQARRRDR